MTSQTSSTPAPPALPLEAQQEDFASLGLFDEAYDADCVELFADAFRDAANLEIGDQVLLEALGQDWWDDEPAAAAPAPAAEPLKAAPSVAPAPVRVPVHAPVHAPVQQPTTATTYKSLTAQIAIVAPCFNSPAYAMPNLMMTSPAALPACASVAAATAAAGGIVADFSEFDMHMLDTRARRQIAIARWKEKRKRRNFGEKHRFPEYACRRQVANRRPRVNGRFIREQPVYVSISELQATHQL